MMEIGREPSPANGAPLGGERRWQHLRPVEAILHGAPRTPFLNTGDRVRIAMNDAQGHAIFGAIEQDVIALG